MGADNTALLVTGHRNAWVLAVCQGLYICAISVDLTLTGLAGYQLAPEKILATLPFALITVGAAIITVFAAFIIGRLGRRFGFAIGSLAGACGGLISVWAIFYHDFWAFCLGNVLVGAFQGFAQYYAIAAADSVPSAYKSRAISTVLTGGVLAALLGPMLAAWTGALIAGVMFAGAYLLVAILALISTLLMITLYRDIEPEQAAPEDNLPPRPLREIFRQPIFGAGLAATMAAAACMILVMTAAPLAAVSMAYTIDDGAHIIQWHLIGMFVPAFFSGRLVARYGVSPVLFAGLGMIVVAALTAISWQTLPAFYISLFLVGMGWNFLIVSGTTLIAKSYRPNERAKTQALTGLARNVAGAMAALSAGGGLEEFGWSGLNACLLPLVLLCLVVVWRWVRPHEAANPVAPA